MGELCLEINVQNCLNINNSTDTEKSLSSITNQQKKEKKLLQKHRA